MRKILWLVLAVLSVVLLYRGYEALQEHRRLQHRVAEARQILSIPIHASGKEHAIHAAGMAFREMLLEGRFAEIETAEKRIREQRELIADGQPRLAALYRGVAMCVDKKCPDADAPEADWIAVHERLEQWAETGSVLALLARVHFQRAYAWRARGPGFVDTVPSEQWPIFRQRVAAAQALFAELPAAAAQMPWYAELMLLLHRDGGNWSRTEALQAYEYARARDPWYLSLYFVRGSLSAPKWGGSIAEHAEFVEQEIARADSPDLAAVLYARLHWSNQSWMMFADKIASWPKFRDSFDRLVELHPDQWNINNYGQFACNAGDHVRLHEQLLRMEYVIVPAWHDLDLYIDCRDRLLQFKYGAIAVDQALASLLDRR